MEVKETYQTNADRDLLIKAYAAKGARLKEDAILRQVIPATLETTDEKGNVVVPAKPEEVIETKVLTFTDEPEKPRAPSLEERLTALEKVVAAHVEIPR